jgi:UDP-N-acetylglucosamine 2-epimerase (non-hydrolysing)
MRFVNADHMNPKVAKPTNEILGEVQNIVLLEPLDYICFNYFMLRCFFIITDSGGIQEETITFINPMLITRFVSERQEAVSASTVKLVRAEKQKLLGLIAKQIMDNEFHQSIHLANSPFGN